MCGWVVCGLLLPWFELFGFSVSGRELAELGSTGTYLWVVPVLSGVTLRLIGVITGLVPLGAILYAVIEMMNLVVMLLGLWYGQACRC